MKKEGLPSGEREVVPTQSVVALINNTISELNTLARAKGNYHVATDAEALENMGFIAGSVDSRLTFSPQQQVLIKKLLLGYFGQCREDIDKGLGGPNDYTPLSIVTFLNSFKKDLKKELQPEDSAKVSVQDFLANFSRRIQSGESRPGYEDEVKKYKLSLLSLIGESSKTGVMLNVAQQKLLGAALRESLYKYGKRVHYELFTDLGGEIKVDTGILEIITFINGID